MGSWNDRLLMLQLIKQSYYITHQRMRGVKKDGFFRYDETPNPLGQWSWLLKKNPGPNDGICDPDGDPYPDKPDSAVRRSLANKNKKGCRIGIDPATLLSVDRRRGLLCAYARPAFFKDCSSSRGSPVASAILVRSSPIRSRFCAVSVLPS